MDSWVDNFSYSDDEEYIPTSQEAKDDDMLTVFEIWLFHGFFVLKWSIYHFICLYRTEF